MRTPHFLFDDTLYNILYEYIHKIFYRKEFSFKLKIRSLLLTSFSKCKNPFHLGNPKGENIAFDSYK